MKCICPDKSHDTWTALWHHTYCRWYDHDRADHGVRAVAWGVAADLLCAVGDRLRLWGVAR